MTCPIRKVELLGFPGAGKSTVAAGVIEELRRRGLDVAGRAEQQQRICRAHASVAAWRRAAEYAAFSLHDRRRIVAIARLAARVRPLRPAALRRVYVLSRQLHNKAILGEDLLTRPIWILDQDLLQELCYGIFYLRPCPDERALERVIAQLSPLLADVVVHLRIDPAVAVARMRRRTALEGPGGEIDRLPVLSANEMSAAVTEEDRILRILRERSAAQVITLDAASPPSAQIDQVVRAVESRLENGRRTEPRAR